MKMYILIILLTAVVNFTQGKIFNPKTSEEFQSAINDAFVEDTIKLLPQDYRGDFVLPSKSGSVKINGTFSSDFKKLTKIFGKQNAFSISGDKWELRFLTIESGEVGIEVKGSNNILNSLSIHNVNKGIVINGDDNLVHSLTIRHGTHAILVKGSRNTIKSVTCSDMREESIIVESGSIATRIDSVTIKPVGDSQVSILLKEGSSQGVLNSLSLDGIVQVRGDYYKITSCSFKNALNFFGTKNSIDSSSVRVFYAADACRKSVQNSNFINVMSDSPVNQ